MPFPEPQILILFGKKVIKEVISEDEVLLEWGESLIQYNSCPYKKEDRQRHGENTM